MSPTDTPHVIRRMVQDVLSAGTIIRHYVLISSDSVFMASDRATIRAKQGPGGLREGDAIEPIGSIAVKSARRRNRYQFSYGGNKAQAERTLQGQGAAFPRWTVLLSRRCRALRQSRYAPGTSIPHPDGFDGYMICAGVRCMSEGGAYRVTD